MSDKLVETEKGDLIDAIGLLQKSSVKDKFDAMRKLLSMICKGKDCGDAFVEVVKNVHIENVSLARLIGAYVIHHSSDHPTETLLAVSTHVRSLTDPKPDVRLQALKSLSSLKTPVVVQDILSAAETCISDSNPHIRKTALFSLMKACILNSSSHEMALQLTSLALGDNNVLVVCSALVSLIQLELTHDFELIKSAIHPNYRKIVHLLCDFDHQHLPSIIDLLVRYVRTEFNLDLVIDKKEQDSEEEDMMKAPFDSITTVDFDHRLFLESIRPLLHHINPSVVVSACLAIYHTCPPSSCLFSQMVDTVLKLVVYRYSTETQFFILNSLLPIIQSFPQKFNQNFKKFFIIPSDPMYIRNIKLKFLINLVTVNNSHVILKELLFYSKSNNEALALKSVESIAEIGSRCVKQNNTGIAVDALKSLIKLIGPFDPSRPSQSNLIDRAVLTVSELLSLSLNSSEMSTAALVDILCAILRRFDVLSSAGSRSAVVHLFRQYGYLVPNFAREMLRIGARNFKEEEVETKFAILSMSAVMLIKYPNDLLVSNIGDYVLKCARYDHDYALRSRTRFIQALINQKEELMKSMIDLDESESVEFDRLIEEMMVSMSEPFQSTSNQSILINSHYLPGSLSFILNTGISGHLPLPSWTFEPSTHGLRSVDEPVESEQEEEEDDDESNKDVVENEEVEVESSEDEENDDDFWNFDDKKQTVKKSSPILIESNDDSMIEESDGYEYESYTDED
ncbi:hypothetical protein RCL1_006903 [Eukaryota sp. TZLM3-RCL]